MAPADGPADSLGVTALLDELLLEEQALERLEEPQLSAEDQQQLTALHKDVDGCLASMAGWEEESRLRKAKLMQELEAEFGFSCDLEAEAARDANQELEDCHARREEEQEEEDISRYLGGVNRRQHHPRQPVGPLMDEQAHARSSSSTPMVATDEARQADAERIQRLRSEVEAMRDREMMGLGPYNVMVEPDESDAIVGASAGLSAWCEEVDAVLDDPALGEGSGARMLAGAGLSEIGAGLEVAQSRLNDDILEMENLLAECGAQIQARKAAMDSQSK